MAERYSLRGFHFGIVLTISCLTGQLCNLILKIVSFKSCRTSLKVILHSTCKLFLKQKIRGKKFHWAFTYIKVQCTSVWVSWIAGTKLPNCLHIVKHLSIRALSLQCNQEQQYCWASNISKKEATSLINTEGQLFKQSLTLTTVLKKSLNLQVSSLVGYLKKTNAVLYYSTLYAFMKLFVINGADMKAFMKIRMA